jgi:hypothetical protein
MAWIDDRIWCHPKFTGLSPAGFATYVKSVAYASGMGTKGHLDPSQQKLVGGRPIVRAELIAAGLWDINGDGQTVVIHDWDEHNGKRDERRRKDRERKRELRRNTT